MEHKLVKYDYQLGSYPPFRHYAECKCGFQCRVGTKEAAESQFNNHLMTHSGGAKVEQVVFPDLQKSMEELNKQSQLNIESQNKEQGLVGGTTQQEFNPFK